MEERASKIRPLHTVNCCSVLKRKEILSQVPTGMNLEDIVLSEIRQSRKDRHGSIYTRSLLLLLLLLLRRLTRVRLCVTP